MRDFEMPRCTEMRAAAAVCETARQGAGGDKGGVGAWSLYA